MKANDLDSLAKPAVIFDVATTVVDKNGYPKPQMLKMQQTASGCELLGAHLKWLSETFLRTGLGARRQAVDLQTVS